MKLIPNLTALLAGLTLVVPSTTSAAVIQSGVRPSWTVEDTAARSVRDTTPHPESQKKEKKGLPLEPARTIAFTTTTGSWMSLDVSPDGTTIVFDMLGDLYTLPITGGTATRLTSGIAYDAQPRFSPDGKRIAFVSDRSGDDNVWVISADGRDSTQITRGDDNGPVSPAWTPDGKYIVVSMHEAVGSAAKLWMFNVDGGTGVQIIREPANRKTLGAAFGPDPRYLWYAFRTNDFEYNVIFPQYQLAVYDRDAGTQTVMTSRYGSAFRPAPSPDGKWLAYGTRWETKTGLRLRNLATGDESWLVYPIQRDDQESRATMDVLPGYAFTPDSKSIVISYGGEIWRVPIDGSAPVRIPLSVNVSIPIGPAVQFTNRVDESPTFTAHQIRDAVPSPDGKQLAFSALDRIYVMDYPNGTPHRVSALEVNEQYPAWSPDGKSLAWTTWDDKAGGQIYTARVDGSGSHDVQQLTSVAGLYSQPAWSPNGRRIIALQSSERDMQEATTTFQHLGEQFVWVSADGGATHVIAPSAGRTHPHFVAADSTRIYAYSTKDGLVSFRWDGTDVREYLKVTGPSPTPGQHPPASLVIMSPRGGQALAQVGSHLYVVAVPYVGGETPTVSVANVEKAAVPVRKLTDIGGEFPAWSADGRVVHWSLGNAHDAYNLDRAQVVEDSLAAHQSSDSLKGAKPAGYVPEEHRVVVTATRDIPHGTVVLRGAKVITMKGDQIINDADIVIHDNRIAAVGARGTVTVPQGAKVIDMSGTTIVPGFVDVHYHPQWLLTDVHNTQVWQYLPELAYGTTTTRDPQTGTTDVLTYEDRVESGAMIGPRIFSTGPGVESSQMISTMEQARDVLKRYATYYDVKTLKDYMSGNRRERELLVMAARDAGVMPTTEGALDYKLNLTHVLDGYPGLEHTLPITPLYNDVVQLLARSGTNYDPTLIVSYGGPWGENYFYTHENVHGDPKLRHFTPESALDSRTRRRGDSGEGGSIRSPGGWFMDDEYVFRKHANFVKDLLAAGGHASIGGHGQISGIGYHWEMWMMHMGGVANHDVLRMATILGAEAIGLGTDLGSIEPGKLADLVVLNKDPLADIRNTNTIRYVMKNGRLYEGNTLDEVWPRQRKLPSYVWQNVGPTERTIPAGTPDW